MCQYPVLAVICGGIVAGTAGSTITTSGTISGDTIGYLIFFSVSVITENAAISDAVPLVDGIATNLALFLNLGNLLQ